METRRQQDHEQDSRRRSYEVGDVVRLRKQHPCGSSEWEILRTGADFRLKCLGCARQIMVPRRQVERSTKELIKKEKGTP